MSPKLRLDPHTMGTGFTIAAAMAMGLWLAFAFIAQPPGLSRRLADLDVRLAEIERLSDAAKQPMDHPGGAVCHDAATLAAIALKQRLQNAATANGLTVASLTTSPGASDEAMAGLTPVVFSIEATGRYDQAVLLISSLGKTQPEIFVDQADLKSMTSSVSLKLTGRLYCLTSAPL